MLRLTDTLYRWTGDAIYADFFERGYFNHVLAMQNRSELGGYLYDHPLGSCSRKVFGHSHDAFWCCYGSSIEAFSRLAAGIFYQADDALIVNLPVAAEVRWRGVRVTQSAAYPFDGSASLSIACDTPTAFTLKVRIPSWCQGNASATLNGRAVTLGGGRYLSIARTWESGDVVALQLRVDVRVDLERRQERSAPDDAVDRVHRGVEIGRHAHEIRVMRCVADDLRAGRLDRGALLRGDRRTELHQSQGRVLHRIEGEQGAHGRIGGGILAGTDVLLGAGERHQAFLFGG